MSIIEVGYLMPGHSAVKVLSSGSTYEGWERGPNHVDGVGVSHEYYNASDKTIKYVTFTYEAYNKVFDKVACQTTGEFERSAEITGPIKPHTKYEIKLDALWYNPTVFSVKITQIHVRYMDNTEETIPGDQVVKMSDDNSEYKKRVEAEKAAEAARKQQQKEEAAQAVNALKDSIVGGIKGLFKKK